jgi:hypothetical protein
MINSSDHFSSEQPDPTPVPTASAMARAFDADISIGETAPTLFYVVANEGTPDAAVGAVGGKIVGRLLSERQALALAPLAAHSTLRDHPDLKLAGPVMVDPERFNRFGRMIARAAQMRQRTASQAEPTHNRIGDAQ